MDIVERLRKTISNMDAPVENDLLREAADEIERLDYLHKLDHSLADQWRERAEQAEAALLATQKELDATRRELKDKNK